MEDERIDQGTGQGIVLEDFLSENIWRALIIASSAAILLFSIYCLSHGITIIFMHLYYFPIVLLAYRYRHDRTVLFANQAFLQHFHKTAQDTIGYIFRINIHPDDDVRVQEHFRSLTLDCPVGSIEYRIIMPDGTVRSQQWINRALFDDHGRVSENQSVGRDSAERKEAG
jgi:PAS domain-containing protein